MDPAEHDWTAAEEEWRRRAARFAAEELAPFSRTWDRAGRIPREVFARLGALGFLGLSLPGSVGGGGASVLAGCLVAEEIGAVDGSVRGFLAVQSGLVASPIAEFGSPDQRARWLPGLLAGTSIGCCALTEPGAGSDLGAIATSVRREGEFAVLDGEKTWITNGGIADVALVFATADPAKRHKGLECWIVPTSTPGFRAEPMPGAPLGHRASDHARLVLSGVRVPASHRLGDPGAGFAVAMRGLEVGRLNVAAGAVGIHRACFEAAVAFAKTRRQFGQRLGDFQQVGATLAEMAVDLSASRLLVHHAARLADRGAPSAPAVAAAKLRATESAVAAATRTIQVHGARGYADDLPLERFYRDALALTIYEGASNIQRLILSRALLGKDEGAPR